MGDDKMPIALGALGGAMGGVLGGNAQEFHTVWETRDRWAEPIIGDPDHLADIIGRYLAREAFEFVPWGPRLLLFRDMEPELTSGGIVRPDTVRGRLNSGWIISIGHCVGYQNNPSGQDFPLGKPRDQLIGTKVLFESYSGYTIYIEESDRAFDSAYMVIVQGELWGEDLSGPQWNRKPDEVR